MLSFIHTYTKSSFPAFIRSGLWRNGHGLKLMHKPGFQAPYDFNSACSPGSHLSALLEDLRCPFYIDRLQGGLALTNTYPFDPAIFNRLRMLLGDRFLGIQMHEWASNFRSDQQRIHALCNEQKINLSNTPAAAAFWQKVMNGTLPLFMETYTAAEWSRIPLRSGFMPRAVSVFQQNSIPQPF